MFNLNDRSKLNIRFQERFRLKLTTVIDAKWPISG
jgi:hypothetical protein